MILPAALFALAVVAADAQAPELPPEIRMLTLEGVINRCPSAISGASSAMRRQPARWSWC